MNLQGVAIGQLDKKVIIERPTYSADSVSSEQTKTWSTFATVWANQDSKSGEKFENNQEVALINTTWTIRWVSGVDETMRINDSGTYYQIKGINEIGRRVFLTLMTEKRNNG